MCGSTPSVQEHDPVKDAQVAADKAAALANAATAARRRMALVSGLAVTGGRGVATPVPGVVSAAMPATLPSSTLASAYGKQTLGS